MQIKNKEEYKFVPIAYLGFSTRTFNCLMRARCNTLYLLIEKYGELPKVRNMGAKSLAEVEEVLERVSRNGEAAFLRPQKETKEKQEFVKINKREIDIDTVRILQESYDLKTAWLCEWYGLSRQGIYNKLEKKHNKGNWRNKELLQSERRTLTDMINAKLFYREEKEKKYYLVNNLKDDCACIIVTDFDIKCYFLQDLPIAMQSLIKMHQMHRLSEAECENYENLGKKVSILKREHFMPNDASVFRSFAMARGLSTEEYSLFLFGLPLCQIRTSITDERIIEFLKENTVNGQTYITATPENQWIRSYISRSQFNTEEFIAFYGFNTNKNVEDTVLDFNVEDIRTVESDMQVYKKGEDSIERLFSNTPLLGSRVLSKKNLDILYLKSRRYVDQFLNNPSIKPNLKQKMWITLAVINYAKEWNTEGESGFWRYITAQFGYRDESGQLRNLLCSCVKDALVQNNRWFVTNASGNQFKSSIVIHAFSTKRSWLYFCDFLFDFYKSNLNWDYIEDDPMIARMVLALRNKINASNDTMDEDIEISSKVYNFREGIIKLIVYRPKYAIQLISSLIKRIDGLINHTNVTAVTYEEQLCDEWMNNKIQGILSSRKRELPREKRTVAIDYTRIRPLYQLYNENEIRIVFPDIRLVQNDFSSLKLTVCCNGNVIEEKSLSYYGNELGKTIRGFVLNLEDFLRKSLAMDFEPQVIITCDDKEIYNSQKVLYRKFLMFKGNTELTVGVSESGGYSLFTPSKTEVEICDAEISLIKENVYIKGCYVELKKGFIINIDGELAFFDNAQSGGAVRIIIPNSKYAAEYVQNGVHYSVMSGKETIRIISTDCEKEKHLRLVINSDSVSFKSLPYEENNGTKVYQVEVGKLETDNVSLRLIDISNNRLLFKTDLKVIHSFQYSFSRSYFFADQDYYEARLRIEIGEEKIQEYPIALGDFLVRVPYQDGEIEIAVPKIKVVDNANVEWNGKNLYWIKDIPQERFLYVKTPAGVNAEMVLNGGGISTESNNAFALGNAVYNLSGFEDNNLLKLQLIVSSNGQKMQKYDIGSIAVREQFIEKPVLKLDSDKLSWNCGHGFLGDKNSVFRLNICEGTEYEKTYELCLEDGFIAENVAIPLGEYKFSIEKQSGNLFVRQFVKIATGSLFVGDDNELRFLKSIIQIDTITFEDEDKYENVKIRSSYIDQIEYKGVRYVASEGRECPIYIGIMYFVSDSGRRHEYSYKDTTDEKGHLLYQINPVRIVYINESTLSITHETGDPEDSGDGFYYYRYFDKYALSNVFQITDWEPTKYNRNQYYLADLYSYTRKEV